MELRKFIALGIVFGFMTTNLSYANGDYWVITQETYQETQTQPYYYNSAYPQQSVVTTTTTVREKTFSEKHPVLTTLGVGALLVGGITAGVMLADNHSPRHHHPQPPHTHHRYRG